MKLYETKSKFIKISCGTIGNSWRIYNITETIDAKQNLETYRCLAELVLEINVVHAPSCTIDTPA